MDNPREILDYASRPASRAKTQSRHPPVIALLMTIGLLGFVVAAVDGFVFSESVEWFAWALVVAALLLGFAVFHCLARPNPAFAAAAVLIFIAVAFGIVSTIAARNRHLAYERKLMAEYVRDPPLARKQHELGMYFDTRLLSIACVVATIATAPVLVYSIVRTFGRRPDADETA